MAIFDTFLHISFFFKDRKRKKELNSTIQRMAQEINESSTKYQIDIIEDVSVDNIQELSTNEEFFHLPLTNIFSVLSKVDFELISEKYNANEILQKHILMKKKRFCCCIISI